MLLAIDCGNTETVIGMYRDAELVDHWRIATNAERTSDEHAALIAQFLSQHGMSFEKDVTGLAVCSGVPRVRAALREMADRYFTFPALIVEPGVRTGMPILYDDPKQVGADRIANAVAAYDLYGGPTVCVDFGTATTFDIISAKGEYLGGAIVPGIEISLDALYARAAALFRIELVEPRSVIGRSTTESIQSGTLYGYAAMVDGMVARIEAEIGECTVISTGGLGSVVAPHATRVQQHEPWLTLHGLRIIHERNL